MTTQLFTVKLKDDDAERVRQSHARAIEELQALPILSARRLRSIALPNAVEVEIPHGLGRVPQMVSVSPPLGAASVGLISLVVGKHASGAPIDPSQSICLLASAFGSTITVDVMVW
jgi:hypothetical protein